MKTKWLAVGIILFFIGIAYAPAIAQDVKTSQSTTKGIWLYVGGGGPGNYTRIQDAIDNASNEDTVFVYSGVYYENIVINKSISLVGEDKATTIIDGGGIESVIFVSVDWVNISGFTIQKGILGIRIYQNNCIISDNTITNSVDCIFLYGSNGNTITDNTISSNNENGIHLYDSSCNTITGNTIINNIWNGIRLYRYSSGNTITGNTITNNGRGISLYDASDNIITDNTITNNRRGIHLVNSSSGNIITGNTITNSSDGIHLHWYSSGNTITGNTISSNNENGIHLYDYCDNNTIRNNNFLNNAHDAFFNTSRGNIWYQNYWNRPRILPKLIFGTIMIRNIQIHWVNIDWRPALKPYDIPG